MYKRTASSTIPAEIISNCARKKDQTLEKDPIFTLELSLTDDLRGVVLVARHLEVLVTQILLGESIVCEKSISRIVYLGHKTKVSPLFDRRPDGVFARSIPKSDNSL